MPDRQALAELAERCGHAPLVIDAAQAGLYLKDLWADRRVTALAIGGHKLGGPTGVGALLLRQETPFTASLKGGHQEQGLRAGTEAVPLIAGFARALSETNTRRTALLAGLSAATHAFEQGLSATAGARIHGRDRQRAPGVTSCAILGVPGRNLVEALDRRGIAVSAGAACASALGEASDVMRAMGYSRERALEAFRVSFGYAHSADQARRLAASIGEVARELRGESVS
jgi:cysteine desulfurase